jgi:hypothetical protein
MIQMRKTSFLKVFTSNLIYKLCMIQVIYSIIIRDFSRYKTCKKFLYTRWKRRRRKLQYDPQRMLDSVNCRRGHTCFGWKSMQSSTKREQGRTRLTSSSTNKNSTWQEKINNQKRIYFELWMPVMSRQLV